MSRIFLDLDGVLVDFVGGMNQSHGHDGYDPTQWNYHRVDWDMPDHEFWSPARDAEWWSNLEWTAEGPAILRCCEDAVGREHVYILTSGRAGPAAAGKTHWVHCELGSGYLDRLLISHSKYVLARPDHLLIDDGTHNVDAFRDHGGTAILVPRPWNTSEPIGESVIAHVETSIQEWRERESSRRQHEIIDAMANEANRDGYYVSKTTNPE